jgi:hypothetical protein
VAPKVMDHGLKEGDRNMKFFHNKVFWSAKKNKIIQ